MVRQSRVSRNRGYKDSQDLTNLMEVIFGAVDENNRILELEKSPNTPDRHGTVDRPRLLVSRSLKIRAATMAATH